MTDKQCSLNNDAEMEASKKRSDRIKEINKSMAKDMDPTMAKMLAEIEARNKAK